MSAEEILEAVYRYCRSQASKETMLAFDYVRGLPEYEAHRNLAAGYRDVAEYIDELQSEITIPNPGTVEVTDEDDNGVLKVTILPPLRFK